MTHVQGQGVSAPHCRHQAASTLPTAPLAGIGAVMHRLVSLDRDGKMSLQDGPSGVLSFSVLWGMLLISTCF